MPMGLHDRTGPLRSGPHRFMAVLVLLVSGCGKPQAVDTTQIAAQVNGGEISVHQVQAALQRQDKPAAALSDNAASQALEVLIDQELAAQAAVKQGLESDPAVIQLLQLAKREALAHAYHQRLTSTAAAPSSDDIDRFYDTHLALFAQRKLYTLQEFAVETDPSKIDRIREISRQAKGVPALTAALQTLGVRFSTRQVAQAAEDIPLALLEPLASAALGETVFVPGAAGARLFVVLHAQPAPIERRLAIGPITRYLLAERKRETVVKAMAALRKDGQVRYVGSFAKLAASAPSAPAADKAVARP